MRPIQLVLAFCVVLVPTSLACSSSSSSTGTPDGGGPVDHGGGEASNCPASNPGNCVAQGAMGNSLGIGAYCSKGCGECAALAHPGSVLLCSVDFGAPANAAFCTKPCQVDTDCGSGATCVSNPLGMGCAVAACIPPDSGGPPPSDAGSGDTGPG